MENRIAYRSHLRGRYILVDTVVVARKPLQYNGTCIIVKQFIVVFSYRLERPEWYCDDDDESQ